MNGCPSYAPGLSRAVAIISGSTTLDSQVRSWFTFLDDQMHGADTDMDTQYRLTF
jgi:hypothetical protein